MSACCLFLFFSPSIALPVGLFETPVSFLSLVLHMTCHPLTGLELLHRKIEEILASPALNLSYHLLFLFVARYNRWNQLESAYVLHRFLGEIFAEN